MKNNWNEVSTILKKGGVAVIPTDTLYGIVARALDKKAVERIYKIKGRDDGKPVIVLISSFADLKQFGVKLTGEQRMFLDDVWPGKISVILPCSLGKFAYLHQGTKSIAFRMVGLRNRNLYNLLRKVGPLAAPSANPQGAEPAKTVWEAKKYFEDDVDVYACGHTRISKPSTLVRYEKGKLVILRQGAVKIKTK
jgi:L-threonylcarbamoyladenylate synthase